MGTAKETQAANQAANETQSVNNTQPRVVQVGTETPAIQLRAIHGRTAIPRVVHVGTETPATQVRVVHGGTAVQETRLRTSDLYRSQEKREDHGEWDQIDKVNWMKRINEFGSVGGPKNKCSRIRGRSEQMLNVQWRSWETAVLINCATVRRRDKWSRHDGVIERKVTHRTDNLWRDSFEKEQIPVYRKVHQDQMRRRLADLSGTIMHTPITEELLVETPEEANVAKATARRLRRAMEQLR